MCVPACVRCVYMFTLQRILEYQLVQGSTAGFLEERGNVFKTGGTGDKLWPEQCPSSTTTWLWDPGNVISFFYGIASTEEPSNTIPPQRNCSFHSCLSAQSHLLPTNTSITTIPTSTLLFFIVPSIPDVIVHAYVLTYLCSISPIEFKFNVGKSLSYYPLPASSIVSGTW